jgi:hypothetical protein
MASAHIFLVCLLGLLVLADRQTLGVEAARDLRAAQQQIPGCSTYGELVCMQRQALAVITCLQACAGPAGAHSLNLTVSV